MGVTSKGPFEVAMACDLDQVRAAARAVRRFLAEKGCDEEEMLACDLALVEACNNAVKFAKGPQRREPVLVETTCDANQIELRITDHTSGFDWPVGARLPDPESEGGRGLFLIQSLVDYARYFPGGDGNVLVLRKRREG